MRKYIMFKKDPSDGNYYVVHIGSNVSDTLSAVRIKYGDFLQTLLIPVLKNKNTEYIKVGDVLSPEIFQSFIECKGIDSVAFVSAVNVFNQMDAKSRVEWADSTQSPLIPINEENAYHDLDYYEDADPNDYGESKDDPASYL